MAQQIDHIKSLCDHVSGLLGGVKVTDRIVPFEGPTTAHPTTNHLVLVLHGIDIDTDGQLHHETEDEDE